ncbi:MAG: hypothetical protein HYX97_05730 [Chloroflexi bacterium]|nr:hypothetical protein [Chloroflexota bacterium]
MRIQRRWFPRGGAVGWARLLALAVAALALSLALPGRTDIVVAATFTVNSTADLGDSYLDDGICDTANFPSRSGRPAIPPSGICTLRAAIMQANSTTAPDVITFNIPGPGPHVIAPPTMLPTIINPVTIDGATQPGYAGTPLIELNGSNIPPPTPTGLAFLGGTNTVRGLAIHGFGGAAVLLAGPGGNVVEGNYIGISAQGVRERGNGLDGIQIISSGNRIGGTTAAQRNVLAGNGESGIDITGPQVTGNRVQGNYIGTNPAGDDQIPNGHDGVHIHGGAENLIGGTEEGARNIISGNTRHGVMVHAAPSDQNRIEGNFIGTDVAGRRKLGNRGNGVAIYSGFQNVVGGPSEGARNIISGNGQSGVQVAIEIAAEGPQVRPARTLVQGNVIGTNFTGTADLGNGAHGVYLQNATDTTVGGIRIGLADPSNTIAFNARNGVEVVSGIGNNNRANRIYSNVGLGIDVGGNGVDPAAVLPRTPLGGQLSHAAPRIRGAEVVGETLFVTGAFLTRPRPDNYRLDFYLNTSCDPSGFGEGEAFLGWSPVTSAGGDETPFEVRLLEASSAIGRFLTATATIIETVGENTFDRDTSEFSGCVQVRRFQSSTPTPTPQTRTPTPTRSPTPTRTPTPTPRPTPPGEGAPPPSTVQFLRVDFRVTEDSGAATIIVTRAGSSRGAVTVEFETGTGTQTASRRVDYQDTFRILEWPDGNSTEKTVRVPILQDSLAEGNESVSLRLRDPAGAALGVPNVATLTILDSLPPTLGPSPTPEFEKQTPKPPTPTARPTPTPPAPVFRTLTVSHGGGGQVVSQPAGIDCQPACAVSFLEGTVVTLNAVPDLFAEFGGWSGACSGQGICTVTMDRAREVRATFTYTLRTRVLGAVAGSVISNPAGINCGVACSAEFRAGRVVQLRAQQIGGANFVAWTGACAGRRACNVAMDTDKSVEATFGYHLEVKKRGEGFWGRLLRKKGAGKGMVTSEPPGIDCGKDCQELYVAGAQVTLKAVPDAGSTFAGWSGAGACPGKGDCAVLMTVRRKLTATFDRMPTIVIQKPKAGQTVKATEVEIQTKVANRPKGSQLRFHFDERQVAQTAKTKVKLAGLSPGEHAVMVEVVGGAGESFDPPVRSQVEFRYQLPAKPGKTSKDAIRVPSP